MTKLQRRNAAARRSRRSRLAKAAHRLLKVANPSAVRTSSGASIVRLKGGGVTIRPIKSNPKRVARKSRRRRR